MDESIYDVSLENNAFLAWVLVDRVSATDMYRVEVQGMNILVPPETFFEKEFGAVVFKDFGKSLDVRADLLIFENNYAVLHCDQGNELESEFCIFSPPKRKGEDGEYLEGVEKKFKEEMDTLKLLEGCGNAKAGIGTYHLLEYYDRLYNLGAASLNLTVPGTEVEADKSELISEDESISKALKTLSLNGYQVKKKFFGSGWICRNDQGIKIHFKTEEQLMLYVAQTYGDN